MMKNILLFIILLSFSQKSFTQENYKYVINDMLDKIYEQNIQNAEFKEDSGVTDSIYVLNNAFTNEYIYSGKYPIKIGFPCSSDSFKKHPVFIIQKINKKRQSLQIRVSIYSMNFENGEAKLHLGGGYDFYYKKKRKYEYKKVKIWGI
jgi:hypothetical protein